MLVEVDKCHEPGGNNKAGIIVTPAGDGFHGKLAGSGGDFFYGGLIMSFYLRNRRSATATALFLCFAATNYSALAQEGDAASEQRGGIPTVTVTSQRTEQALQSVPIAVTAFDSESLKVRQIETFSDLQFNTPNVSFSKANFTGTNFQIRGVGTTLVAASADGGVGILVNDVPLNQPRLFETEYYDVERIEILRGPQGTLFGRNATAGIVNMHTAKPVLGEFMGSAEFEYGNYDSTRVEGMLNIPIGDKVAMRFAGNWVKRDGYTDNLVTGNKIDGRDSYSLRGSIRFEPSDRTRIDLMVSYFKEDSNRTRAAKQMCHRDPTGILGCLPDALAFETTNPNATLGSILISNLILGPYGVTNFFDQTDLSAPNPADLRTTRTGFDPVYKSDETLVTLRIEQDLSNEFTLTFTGGYQDTSVNSRQEYFNYSGAELTIPEAVFNDFPGTAATFFPDGMFPLSAVDDDNLGLLGGNIQSFTSDMPSYDQSFGGAEQHSAELRLSSNFDGKFNFQVGGFYLNYQSEFDYYVVAATLDYFSLLGAGAVGVGLTSPYYNNETDDYQLKSWAVFTDATYEFTDKLTLNLGLRYTHDEKSISARQILYDGVYVWATGDTLVGLPDLIPQNATWGEVTGRAVLTWTPNDENMYYASYSRGYKGGGFNPPSFTAGTKDTFDPEFIDAFEIGTKNTFADGKAQANASVFYYDYQGLQVSKIVDRTSVNENIDAKIWGFEGEFLYAPDENWLISVNGSYLNSSIRNAKSVDGRDPTNGSSDVTLIKDFANASNCVINHNGAPPPETVPELAGLFPVGTTNVPGIPATAAFSQCDAAAAGLDAFNAIAGTNYTVTGGVEADLHGNEVQQAPEFTINIGVQYTHYFGNGMNLSGRVDYYYQTSMFARIFNKPIDKIDSWDVVNAQITLTSADDAWHARAFVKNLANSNPITGHYFTDPSSGNFTNVFVLEPRRFGIEVGARF
jgi:iron complex outermembrane recepter protein